MLYCWFLDSIIQDFAPHFVWIPTIEEYFFAFSFTNTVNRKKGDRTWQLDHFQYVRFDECYSWYLGVSNRLVGVACFLHQNPTEETKEGNSSFLKELGSMFSFFFDKICFQESWFRRIVLPMVSFRDESNAREVSDTTVRSMALKMTSIRAARDDSSF